TCQSAALRAPCTWSSEPTKTKLTISPRLLNSSFTRRGRASISFVKAGSSGDFEIARGVEVAAAALLATPDPGTAEEEAAESGAAAPLPNCPCIQTWAAVESFCLMLGFSAGAFWASADSAGASVTLTTNAPLHTGGPDELAPRKSFPGASTLSCLLSAIRNGAPPGCSFPMRAPAGADVSGRFWACASLDPAGSQVELLWPSRTKPDFAGGLLVIIKTS